MSNPITPTLQSVVYIAINVQDVLFGVELVLYIETMQVVFTSKETRCADVLQMLFSTVMFILITILVSTNAIFGDEICIMRIGDACTGSRYSSPILATSAWYMSLGRAAALALQLMTDALLIYRCWTIWNNTSIIILPSILWFASLALGVVVNWMFDTIVTGFLPRFAVITSLAYFGVCILLNTVLTWLICYRIIRYGHWARGHLSREYSSVYFTIAGIIIESALPFTLSGIALLVATALRSFLVIPLSWVYFLMACISPQMLILRLLRRRKSPERNSELIGSTTHLRFQCLSEVPTREGDEPEGTVHLRPLSKVSMAGTQDDPPRSFFMTD